MYVYESLELLFIHTYCNTDALSYTCKVGNKTILRYGFCWERLGPARICKFGIPLLRLIWLCGRRNVRVTGTKDPGSRVDRNTSVYTVYVYVNSVYRNIIYYSLRLSLNPKTRKQRPGIPLYLINSGLLYDVIGGKTRAQR